MSDEWVMVPREPTEAMIRAIAHRVADPSESAFSIYDDMLDAAPAAPVQQAEPVGYFQRDCDYFEQVEDVYQWDADVIPLYLHPPPAEVQRLREALKPFAAIDLTTNQAVDAMDVLRARRALGDKA